MEETLVNNPIVVPESMAIYVAITAALLQILKQLPVMGTFKSYLPLISVAIGLGIAYYTKVESWPVIGAMIGLTASGAYDLVKGKSTKTNGSG